MTFQAVCEVILLSRQKQTRSYSSDNELNKCIFIFLILIALDNEKEISPQIPLYYVSKLDNV